MTLDEAEALAELSLAKMDAHVEAGLAMVSCIEALSPEAYLEIVEEIL